MSPRRNILSKSIRILNLLLDSSTDVWGVRDLGKALSLPPSTVHRSLKHLESEGLVSSDSDGRYRLGLEFYRFVFKAQTKFPIHEISYPYMTKLVNMFNETVLLGLYDYTKLMYFFADEVVTTHSIRHIIPLNEWLPVYAGAGGLAIMAFLNDTDQQKIINETNLIPVTDQTITKPAILRQELSKIRDRGYACTHGQRTPGAAALGAPIQAPDNKVLGSIVITMPEQRFNKRIQHEMKKPLINYAKNISAEITGVAT